jgi:hypothetical protein
MIGNYAKRLLSAGLAAALAGAFPAPQARAQEDVFFEDFSGSSLDRESWLIAEKNWGGTVNIDGEKVDYNGGVISDNVAVRDGNLVLTGLGNLYEGELRGINRNGTRRSDGKRCGGAIATKDTTLQEVMKSVPKLPPNSAVALQCGLLNMKKIIQAIILLLQIMKLILNFLGVMPMMSQILIMYSAPHGRERAMMSIKQVRLTAEIRLTEHIILIVLTGIQAMKTRFQE